MKLVVVALNKQCYVAGSCYISKYSKETLLCSASMWRRQAWLQKSWRAKKLTYQCGEQRYTLASHFIGNSVKSESKEISLHGSSNILNLLSEGNPNFTACQLIYILNYSLSANVFFGPQSRQLHRSLRSWYCSAGTSMQGRYGFGRLYYGRCVYPGRFRQKFVRNHYQCHRKFFFTAFVRTFSHCFRVQ